MKEHGVNTILHWQLFAFQENSVENFSLHHWFLSAESIASSLFLRRSTSKRVRNILSTQTSRLVTDIYFAKAHLPIQVPCMRVLLYTLMKTTCSFFSMKISRFKCNINNKAGWWYTISSINAFTFTITLAFTVSENDMTCKKFPFNHFLKGKSMNPALTQLTLQNLPLP